MWLALCWQGWGLLEDGVRIIEAVGAFKRDAIKAKRGYNPLD